MQKQNYPPLNSIPSIFFHFFVFCDFTKKTKTLSPKSFVMYDICRVLAIKIDLRPIGTPKPPKNTFLLQQDHVFGGFWCAQWVQINFNRKKSPYIVHNKTFWTEGFRFLGGQKSTQIIPLIAPPFFLSFFLIIWGGGN